MRIAQLANFIGPTSGGMKTALEALARGYVAAGHERLLVVPGPVDAITTSDLGDVVQLRAPRVGGKNGSYRLIVEPWRVTEVLSRFGATSLEISDKFTLMPVSWWARRQGIGTVLFSHERLDEYMPAYTGLDTTSKVSTALLNRILVRSFDRLLVTSNYARHEFEPLAATVGCPITQVPLGVDLEWFQPAPTRLDDGVLKLIHVGRLSLEKSPDLAVRVAVELHRRGVPVTLDVYGDGPHREEIAALAEDAPVTFHGHVSDRRRIAKALTDADIALSVCPRETFGLAVLEALASGTPVVTADRGGARELINAECGTWAPASAGALADAVLALAARPTEITRKAARARAEEFPWGRSIDAMLSLHRSLLRGTVTAAYA
ncbi:MAG: glycosyltransferase [Nocardioides sp.]|nr:glycosyltransferase [Nocardioides sp.]